MWNRVKVIAAGLFDKKRSCRAGKEKKGMYKEKSEHDVPEVEEVRLFVCLFFLKHAVVVE